MPPTVIRGKQVLDGSIQRADLDTSTVGQAVVSKLVQGTNVTLSSTGADSGTGDVTISVPAGGQGPAGLNAFNITSGSFTVPNVGSTITVTLNDASWVVIGQIVYVDGAGGGAGQAGALQVTAKSGNQITLLNPQPAPAIPLASTSGPGLMATTDGNAVHFIGGDNGSHAMPIASASKSGDLNQLSGTATDFVGGDNASHPHSTVPLDTLGATTDITTQNATSTAHGLLAKLSGNLTDFVDGTNACQNLVNGIQPTIWSARLRSFNAIGNPTFEIDQRNAGASVTAGGSTWAQDCWQFTKNAGTTMAVTGIQTAGPVSLPGTNFALSASFYRVTLTAAQPSLGASDLIWFTQAIEGIRLRELISDVTSAQILVRSTVAGLKFGFSLRDGAPAPTRSLTKLCTIASANTWTLLTLPNLPLWSGGGSFPITPGVLGYQLSIALAVGSTYIAPANDTWQTGNFVGALGQSNFAASAVNSTFDLAFVQHEPGPLCTTPIDCPFTANLDECLRYYQKSYDYGVAIGATSGLAYIIYGIISPSNTTYVLGLPGFLKPMAKAPTATIYNSNTGAVNSVYNASTAASVAISSVPVGQKGIQYINLATAQAGGHLIGFEYVADTGW